MSLATRTETNLPSSQLREDVFEKVVINQDLSSLKPTDKFEYLKQLCVSLGLNPLTKPFEIMKFNGKEVPYVRKDGTEQLRRVNKVSLRAVETKMIEGSIYVVTAFAKLPDGREDSSTGVVSIKGLQGDALANAMMKAETKAKRRVTLSICGLGFMDESEIESIPNRETVHVREEVKVVELPKPEIDMKQLESDYTDMIEAIKKCDTEAQLRNVFEAVKTMNFKARPDLFKELIYAKDEKKSEILSKQFLSECEEAEKGEVLNESV